MKITKRSPFSGEFYTMDISFLDRELLNAIENRGSTPIQHVPGALALTADEREFIMTGITPGEWESTFGEK